MVDRGKPDQSTRRIGSIIDWFKKYSFMGTLLTIILTAFFTAFFASRFNYNINQRLSVEEYDRSIRDRQMDNIADIIKQVSKVEQLREKVYWSRFFNDVDYLTGSAVNSDEYLKKEDDYRVQYEEASSDFYAAIHLSVLLFDLDKDEAELFLDINKNIGFGYDSTAIKDKWNQLLSEGKTDVEALEEIDEYAEELFNEEFITRGMEYAYKLADKVKSNYKSK